MKTRDAVEGLHNRREFSQLPRVFGWGYGNRVAACLSFKASPGAQPFQWKWVAYSHGNQTHFHFNSWAPRLTSKPRQTATRKWPIRALVDLIHPISSQQSAFLLVSTKNTCSRCWPKERGLWGRDCYSSNNRYNVIVSFTQWGLHIQAVSFLRISFRHWLSAVTQ